MFSLYYLASQINYNYQDMTDVTTRLLSPLGSYWGLNLGLYACYASALPLSYPLPQPLSICFKFWIDCH